MYTNLIRPYKNKNLRDVSYEELVMVRNAFYNLSSIHASKIIDPLEAFIYATKSDNVLSEKDRNIIDRKKLTFRMLLDKYNAGKK
jgi:hypothetical protein